MKQTLLAVALSTVFGVASASGFVPDINNNTTNNIPVANATAGAAAQAGAVAGAAAINSNDLSNRNSNANLVTVGNTNANSVRSSVDNNVRNTVGQDQQQKQGQAQGQQQGIRDSGNSSAASTSGGNTQSNTGNNASTSVAVAGDTYQASRIPVATAYAPSIAATAPCMGSTSGGIQGMSVGISVGSTWVDTNCQLLEQVRAASNIGEQEVAQEMMMSVPAFAEARQRIADRKSGKVVSSNAVHMDAPKVVSAQPVYTDPIIRSRLGLPPLTATK